MLKSLEVNRVSAIPEWDTPGSVSDIKGMISGFARYSVTNDTPHFSLLIVPVADFIQERIGVSGNWPSLGL